MKRNKNKKIRIKGIRSVKRKNGVHALFLFYSIEVRVDNVRMIKNYLQIMNPFFINKYYYSIEYIIIIIIIFVFVYFRLLQLLDEMEN